MKFWSLQALRFWAALGVCVYHACQWAKDAGFPPILPESLANAGQYGVDVFFVLSGFIITKTSPGLSPGAFAFKRAARILPLWYLTAVPHLGYLAATGQMDWRQLLANLALWPATDVMTPPVSVGWTLCFEALFYAVFTLILWRRHAAWIALAVFAFAATTSVGPVGAFLGNPFIAEFLLGVALTRAPSWKPAKFMIPVCLLAFVISAASLQNLTVLQLLRGQDAWERVLLFGVPAALIVWGTLQVEMAPGLLTELGDASYALYLLHSVLLFGVLVLFRQIPGLPPVAVVPLGVVGAVVFSWRFHLLFEKPILVLIRRSARRAAVVPVD